MSESVLRMTPLTFPQNLFRIYNSEEEERGQGGSPALIVFQLPLFAFCHVGYHVYVRARHRCHTPTG